MAVATIHPELRDVNIVRERHRLNWLITDAGVFRRVVIPGRRGHRRREHDHDDRDFERQPVRPARKKVRHTDGLATPPCTHRPPCQKRETKLVRMCLVQSVSELSVAVGKNEAATIEIPNRMAKEFSEMKSAHMRDRFPIVNRRTVAK